MTREQFIALVQGEQQALRSFLLALCLGNKDDADDIAQDALVKAYISSSGYHEQGKFRSWLFKIAHNTYLNHKASQKRYDDLDKAASVVGGIESDSSFKYQELYVAMSSLSPKERSAITMFYMNGYSIKEIAGIVDASEDAVKKQLSRGRDKLKEVLRYE